jgi:transcriptional regulator with XRE-family HTH domain
MPNQIDFKRLGHAIRFHRQGKGWSLADLAKTSGISKTYISDLENGAAGKPNIQYVFSVARALDITLDQLLSEQRPALAPAETGRPLDLPPGLAELRDEQELSDADLQMLSTVNFRGHRPRDKEGWRYLLETLRMLSQRPNQ